MSGKGVVVPSKHLGRYTAEQVQPRDIPDLKSIIEWGNKISPQWKFYYFLLACFGLRGTEAHPKNCKLEDLAQFELMAYAGKTGRWRYVPSCSDELFTALNCPTQPRLLLATLNTLLPLRQQANRAIEPLEVG